MGGQSFFSRGCSKLHILKTMQASKSFHIHAELFLGLDVSSLMSLERMMKGCRSSTRHFVQASNIVYSTKSLVDEIFSAVMSILYVVQHFIKHRLLIHKPKVNADGRMNVLEGIAYQ